jgi:two-component system C4-dicarboxylate transport response regulator DctD
MIWSSIGMAEFRHLIVFLRRASASIAEIQTVLAQLVVQRLARHAERFALGLGLGLDQPGAEPTTSLAGAGNLSEQVEAFERALIAAELNRPHGSLRSVAEALGVPRKTLHDKLRKHGLNFSDAGGSSPDEND